MMLKVMIVFLASDEEGITLKIHLHRRLLARHVARNLKWGGRRVFRRYDTKLGQFMFGIGTVVCLRLGEDQRKKSSSPALGSSFATEFSSSPK